MLKIHSGCDCRFQKPGKPVISRVMDTDYHPLDHYEFVRVAGTDAPGFLQGQLSCNTELLTGQRSLTGAVCNIKGRVIADFRLLKQQDGCILQCAKGMAQPVITTLSRYAVFSKVELSTLAPASEGGNSAIDAIGLIGEPLHRLCGTLGIDLSADDHSVVQSSDFSVIKVPGLNKRVEIWFQKRGARDRFLSSHGLLASTSQQRWCREDIAAGIIHVSPEISEEFTPQLLNYDVSGLIDFTKGCYTGQEIVARMFYRGTAKKRLYLLSSNQTISANSRVIASGMKDATSGTEILAYNNLEDDASLLLSVLTTELAESALPLQLSDQTDSLLNIEKLPYIDA